VNKYKYCLIYSILFLFSLNIKAETSGNLKRVDTHGQNGLVRLIQNPINTADKKNNKHGHYSRDQLKVLWLNNGRKVQLLETLIFTDPNGKKWVAPKGYIVDGASIPFPFQPFIGTPYGGNYVMASIIHDVACDQKRETWQAVHKVFHHAMLASGVSESKAKLMYDAVYEGGPRWGKYTEKKLSKEAFKKYILSEKFEMLNADFRTPDNTQIDLMAGNIKPYSGSSIYSSTSLDISEKVENQSAASIGIGKQFNDVTMVIESTIEGKDNPKTTVKIKHETERYIDFYLEKDINKKDFTAAVTVTNNHSGKSSEAAEMMYGKGKQQQENSQATPY
jgi:hypothetical protein